MPSNRMQTSHIPARPHRCAAVLIAGVLALAATAPAWAQNTQSADTLSFDQDVDQSMGAFSGGPSVLPPPRPSDAFEPWPGHRGIQPFDQKPTCITGKVVVCR